MHSDDASLTNETPLEIETLAGLIRSAGRRADPPPAVRRGTLAIALEAWHRKLAHSRRKRATRFAAAASLVAGLAVVAMLEPLWRTPVAVTPAAVAEVERLIGTVEARLPDEQDWRLLGERTPLPGGARLRTGPGGLVGLRLKSGVSLRLAAGTEVVFARPPLLELAAGRLYVDSAGSDGTPVEVVTSIAKVTDVGTQFEVNLTGEHYRLRVREGRVLLRHGPERIAGVAGDQLTIGTDGAVTRTAIAPTDLEWRWVESIATAPEVNDRPVTALLDWVARETGRAIRFEDAETERRAASTILHGSIHHLAPLDALSVMLATTDLDFVELGDGTLLIQARSAR